MPIDETGLLKIPEVARRLGMSVRWVKYRVESGELRSVKVDGWARRVRVADLEDFERQRIVDSEGGGDR